MCTDTSFDLSFHFLVLLFQAFAKVGIDYAHLCNEPALLEKCKEIATNASWGIKLGRLKVNRK